MLDIDSGLAVGSRSTLRENVLLGVSGIISNYMIAYGDGEGR